MVKVIGGVIVEEKGAVIVSLREVTKTYSTGSEALKRINLEISKGEFVFLVGASGSGKSTFIRLLLREVEPTSGTIVVNGKDITHLKHKQVAAHRRRIGCVFQDFRLLKDRNVYENVAFAQKVVGIPNRLIGKNVYRILSLVGLSDKAKALPSELSGGEQQRVALARALVNEPPILLADEPTGNLDPKNSAEIMQLLEAINAQGTTVIVVTHNNEIVNMMQKRVITLDKGIVYSDEENGSYQGMLSMGSVMREPEQSTERSTVHPYVKPVKEDSWAGALAGTEAGIEDIEYAVFKHRSIEEAMRKEQ